MENTIFGFILFIFYYGFLLLVTDGGNITATSSTESGIDSVTNDPEDVSHETSNSVGQNSDLEDAHILAAHSSPDVATHNDKQIEQQLKDILWEDESHQEVEAVSSTEQGNTITEDEVKELTYRQARKVASKLGIRQKVKGKSVNKAWLIRQIRAKVRISASEVRTAYDQVMKKSAA